MPIITRASKGAPLTHAELDGNFNSIAPLVSVPGIRWPLGLLSEIGVPIDVAMASAPTAAVGSSAVLATAVPYSDSRITLVGASWTLQAGQARAAPVVTDPSGAGTAYTDPTIAFAGMTSGAVLFWTDAPVVEFRFVGAFVRASVFNQATNTWEIATTSAGVAGSTRYLSLTFADRQPRLLRYEITGAGTATYFHSVYVDDSDTVWPYVPAPIRGIVIGDSFAEGTGATHYFDGCYQKLGKMLGIDNWRVCGSGGTGWAATNASPLRANFLTRLSADVLTKGPFDLIVLPVSGNDTALLSEVTTNGASMLRQLRDAFPSARIVVPGTWRPLDTAESAYNALDAAAQAAIAASGVSVDWFSQVGWITGAGKVGTTTGVGNADVYTGSDGTHPSPAGHTYRARRLAAEIRSRFALSV
jgi:lysophospholipase L1-like esterase